MIHSGVLICSVSDNKEVAIYVLAAVLINNVEY